MIKRFLLDLFFPRFCLGCGRYGSRLCESCYRRLRLVSETAHDFGLDKPDLEDIYIAGSYDGDPVLAAAIRRFKYGSEIELGAELGRFLGFFWNGKMEIFRHCDRAKWEELAEASVVPIPLGRKRLKERGFNQAEILARALCGRNGNLFCLGLERKKGGRRQAASDKRGRKREIEGAFRLRKAAGRCVIIVDDIVTTGATLEEAARVLKAGGAEKVYGLVLAKG